MANVDKPSGLKPLRHLNGNPWNGMVNIYYHSASDSVAIFRGDLVQADATNYETTGKYPTVKQHVAGQEDNIGVAIGFGDTPQLALRNTNLNLAQYCPASTAVYIAVVDDPSVVFEVQEDSVGGANTADQVGFFADVVVGSGNTTTGNSAMELDSNTASQATASTLRMLRIVDREDNALGTNAKWEVLINEHLYNNNENVIA